MIYCRHLTFDLSSLFYCTVARVFGTPFRGQWITQQPNAWLNIHFSQIKIKIDTLAFVFLHRWKITTFCITPLLKRNNISSLIFTFSIIFLLITVDEEVLLWTNSRLNSWWESVLSVGTSLELELSVSLLVLPNRSQGTNNSEPLFVC